MKLDNTTPYADSRLVQDLNQIVKEINHLNKVIKELKTKIEDKK